MKTEEIKAAIERNEEHYAKATDPAARREIWANLVHLREKLKQLQQTNGNTNTL